VIAVATAVFLVRPWFVASVDYRVCDLLTGWAPRGEQSQSVVVVGIAPPSSGRFVRWPWRHDLVAELVNRVVDAGAAVIVLDLLLPEEDQRTPARDVPKAPRSVTNDDVLAASLARVPSVLGYSLQFDRGARSHQTCSPPPLHLVVVAPEHGSDAFFHASGLVCTAPVLAHAAAATGFLNAAPDPDGKLRGLPVIAEYGGRYYPSLDLATVDVYHRVSRMQLRADARGAEWLRLDGEMVPLEGHSTLRLRYRGPGRSFPYVSAADLLKGRAPADKLRGKIAIIGASAQGLENSVATPTDPTFPDLEVHATAIDDLVQGDFYHRPSEGLILEVLLSLVAGLAATLVLTFIRSLWAAVITGLMTAVVWAGCSALLSTTGVLISPLPATGVLACVFLALTLTNYRVERRRAERTERQLASARERAEEVRQESESRYQRLVENISDAIITVDQTGRLVFANRRFREWFGLNDDVVRDLPMEDYVAPEFRETVREHRQSLLTGQAVSSQLEYQGIRADGARIWIEALMTTVEEGGRIIGTQSALRDVTERKRLEAQYLQAQKLESLGRLAGGVAHDFNNLLTVINGYSDMLAAELTGNQSLADMARQIHRAGGRAAELTMQLLTFSRKQVVERKPLDLNVVVEESRKMLQRVVGEDVEVESRLGSSLGKVLADAGQMQQVLMNLVVNARDSMPKGGKLTIETRNGEVDEAFSKGRPELAPGRYVYLGVTDTGTGMSEEIQRQIFDPFFTTKEPGKGTGLGLATVYSIVRQNEGAIWVESAPGTGSKFHIYLPWTQTAAPANAAAEPVVVTEGNETLLLVEDQDAVRELIEKMLTNHGYEVLPASNGAEAIGLAAHHPATIHLLITDVILPGMNGRAVADELLSTRPEMKVLYISGYSEEILGRQGVLDSNVAYLTKPFSKDWLVSKVQETLAGKSQAGPGM
jgi:PAS domain S-box-containing protein